MRVFSTGGAGWVGSVTITELLSHGYQVTALARSDKSAASIKDLVAEVIRGDIEDVEVLKSGASAADAVLHLVFATEFHELERGCQVEQAALQAMADAIAWPDKPLVLTSGTLAVLDAAGTRAGEAATEETTPAREVPPFSYRIKSEDLLLNLAQEKKFRGIVVRLWPVVHGKGDIRFTTIFGELAKKNRKAVYTGEGHTTWPAVHRLDAAVLLRLAIEKGKAAGLYHAVAEEGVSMKDFMPTIAKKAEGVGFEEAVKAIGDFANIVGVDDKTSSAKTRSELGWEPKEITLLEDIEQNYFL